ncbi:hypothetical protein ACLX1H_007911 [Fusarium chlamydosporum]
MSDGDVTVMECILDLHSRQGSHCIDVKGSKCEGPDTGSAFGQCNPLPITAQDSKAMQGTVDAIKGKDINGDRALDLYHYNGSDSDDYANCNILVI